MVTVAIAGASSGLGFIIISSLLARKNHTVIALSRSSNDALTALGADVRVVGNYTDHALMVKALQGVHTVVVTMSTQGDMRTAQLNLLAAAKEAGCRRFAPSEWAVSEYADVKMYAPKIPVWNAVVASGLEYTCFTVGLFMNLLGVATPKGEQEALGGIRPWKFIFDIENGTADIPGDGTSRLTLTEIHDIGRFVDAALTLESWPAELGMVGETLSMNEIVARAEVVTKRNFLVKYNMREELAALPKHHPVVEFYNDVRMALLEDGGAVPPVLNEKFPDIRPVSVDEYLQKWWGGVKLPQAAWETAKNFEA